MVFFLGAILIVFGDLVVIWVWPMDEDGLTEEG